MTHVLLCLQLASLAPVPMKTRLVAIRTKLITEAAVLHSSTQGKRAMRGSLLLTPPALRKIAALVYFVDDVK